MNRIALLKWGIVGVMGLGIAWVVLPILVQIALDAVTLAILGIVGMSLVILVPAIAEAMAQLSARLWEASITGSPITRLRRDADANAKNIDKIGDSIGTASARREQMAGLIQRQRDALSKEDLEQYGADLAEMDRMIAEMGATYEEEIVRHGEFERQIKRAEAQYAIGNAFKDALGSLRFRKRTGRESLGSRVAIESIENGLAEARGRLRAALDRPKLSALSESRAIPLAALPTPRTEVRTR